MAAKSMASVATIRERTRWQFYVRSHYIADSFRRCLRFQSAMRQVTILHLEDRMAAAAAPRRADHNDIQENIFACVFTERMA